MRLTNYLKARGYTVVPRPFATKDQILSDLASADAAVFIGHNGTPGGGFMFGTHDGQYVSPFDIHAALSPMVPGKRFPLPLASGRHLQLAIFHVCGAGADPDVRAAAVGNCGGFFYGPKSDWDPVLNTPMFGGYGKFSTPRPY